MKSNGFSYRKHYSDFINQIENDSLFVENDGSVSKLSAVYW